jgi:6-pyruvoyltetrahydropterin/6-carboxytetrahydropterin synthase
MLKVGRIDFSFAAAHNLPGHSGDCKNLHGHNYRLEVELSGNIDPGTGMLADFALVKVLVKDLILNRLDHQYLNELELTIDGYRFPKENPTAENMVTWLSKVLDANYSFTCRLQKIRLWETDNCYVEWERDG